MGKRRKGLVNARPHEWTNRSKAHVRIFEDMMMSESWRGLTHSQRDLYWCMKLSAGKPTQSERKLISKLPEKLTISGNDRSVLAPKTDLFFFNRARWHKSAEELKTAYCFRLYSNQNSFYKDRDELIKHGFIDRLDYQKPDELTDKEWTQAATEGGTRQKALYKLSCRWKYYEGKETK